MDSGMDISMDISMGITLRDRPLHVNDLPPELLDAIFHDLHRPRKAYDNFEDKTDLRTVALVCRLWRSIALDHLFSDVSFGIAEFTDSTFWKGKLAREPLDKRRILSPTGKEVAIHGFVTIHGFLQRNPHISGTVRRLRLHRALQYFPSWDVGLVRIDLNLFQALIELLPRLEELVLSRMVINLPSSSTHVWTPAPLERLFVDYGPAFNGHQPNCEAHTASLLRCFPNLRTLSLRGYHGKSFDASHLAPGSAYPPRLRQLDLHDSHIAASLLTDLLLSPSASTLQHLSYLALAPSAISAGTPPQPFRPVQQALQTLLHTLAPRLRSLACTVAEPPLPPPRAPSELYRSSALDLAPCAALERLRLELVLAPDTAARVWLRVARMLASLRGATQLKVITIKTVHLYAVMNPELVRPVEDVLLELRRVNKALRVEWIVCFSDGDPLYDVTADWIHSDYQELFPRTFSGPLGFMTFRKD